MTQLSLKHKYERYNICITRAVSWIDSDFLYEYLINLNRSLDMPLHNSLCSRTSQHLFYKISYIDAIQYLSFHFPAGETNFSLRHITQIRTADRTFCSMLTGDLSRGYNGRGVKVTTDIKLGPRKGMSGIMPITIYGLDRYKLHLIFPNPNFDPTLSAH